MHKSIDGSFVVEVINNEKSLRSGYRRSKGNFDFKFNEMFFVESVVDKNTNETLTYFYDDGGMLKRKDSSLIPGNEIIYELVKY